MLNPANPDNVEPCCERNPVLWAYFCHASGRPLTRSDVWTEADVINFLDHFEEWPDRPRRSLMASDVPFGG